MNESDPADSSIPNVYSLYPNHHASVLKREPWPQLLHLLGQCGQKIMIGMLLECAIFVTLDAGLGNYYQLSGMVTQS